MNDVIKWAWLGTHRHPLSTISFLSAGFFEAIKQKHSRESDVPVEDVSIKFDDIAHFEKELQVSEIIYLVKDHQL